jgi:hypothetical protein
MAFFTKPKRVSHREHREGTQRAERIFKLRIDKDEQDEEG